MVREIKTVRRWWWWEAHGWGFLRTGSCFSTGYKGIFSLGELIELYTYDISDFLYG